MKLEIREVRSEGEIIGHSDDPKSTLQRKASPALVRILASSPLFRILKQHTGHYGFLTCLLLAQNEMKL